jgi:K+-transporting ATPase A subunit
MEGFFLVIKKVVEVVVGDSLLNIIVGQLFRFSKTKWFDVEFFIWKILHFYKKNKMLIHEYFDAVLLTRKTELLTRNFFFS